VEPAGLFVPAQRVHAIAALVRPTRQPGRRRRASGTGG
jgi:hypothetical protein